MNFPKYPYQPFDEPIPAPPSDKGAMCFTVDAKWKPYLVGLLKTLLVDRTWETDQYRATGEASLLLEEILSADFCPVPLPGLEGDDCMGCCLRWNDGVLEMLSCGEWTPVPGSPGGTPGPGGVVTPDSGGQPGAGECREYNLLCYSNMSAILPIAVSSGDTLEFTQHKGAWSDGFPTPTAAFWYCSGGQLFSLGFCAGATHTESGDPLNTAPHMGLLAEVGGIAQYFFVGNEGSVFVVPPGVTDEQVLFIPNDSSPGDNQGTVSFHVKVCKGAAAPVVLTYNSGTGPLAAAYGSIIEIVSQLASPPGVQYVNVDFNPCCRISIVGGSGWVPDVGIGDWWDYNDCASTLHRSGATTGSEVLTDFPANSEVTNLQLDGVSTSVFTLQVKIDPLP